MNQIKIIYIFFIKEFKMDNRYYKYIRYINGGVKELCTG